MLIMGHRGAAALEPENTLLSIRRAIEIGVDAVEIDVRLSKDNNLVVIHDSTLERTTNGTGSVSSHTLEELKELDAGKGQTIPSLEEVIEFVGDKAKLVIELKHEGTQLQVCELVTRNNLYDNVYVISFWHALVQAIKQRDRNIKTGILLMGCPVDTCVATTACADAFVMKYNFVNQPFVEMAHKENLKVFIWNIDDRNLIRPYVDMGVDGIGSNDPTVLVEYFR